MLLEKQKPLKKGAKSEGKPSAKAKGSAKDISGGVSDIPAASFVNQDAKADADVSQSLVKLESSTDNTLNAADYIPVKPEHGIG
jgi:hypothetical protein